MLIDREREREALAAAMTAARSGNGRMVVIEGPAGCGKTALLRELRQQSDGWQLRQAAGGEFERTASFGVVRELLGGAQTLEDDLGRGAATLAAPLFGPGAEATVDPTTLRHGLYWLIAGIAERAPLALLIDDLQWADRQSLQFVGFLAARLDGLPVALVVAWRPGEPDTDAQMLDRLLTVADVTVVRPRPLDVDGARQLARQQLDSDTADRLAQQIHASSAGNPFLLRELIGELRRRPTTVIPKTPERVVWAVRARIARLPPHARALVNAIALLDRGTLAQAARVAGIAMDPAVEALDALVIADVLRPGRPLAFAHPLVRRAVYDGLPQERRAADHARAARVLAASHADAEDVGRHLLAAEPAGDAWVVDRLIEAQSAALRRGAPDAAARYGRRALAEPTAPERRVDVLRAVADAEGRHYDRTAFEHVDEALALATDPRQRLSIAVQRAHLALALDGDAGDTLSAALRAAPADVDPMLAAIASALMLGGGSTLELAPDRVEQAQAVHARLTPGLPRRILSGFLAISEATQGGRVERARALALEAIGDDAEFRENLDAGWQLGVAIGALAASGELVLATRRIAEALGSARARGGLVGIFNCLWASSFIATVAGDLTTAEADAIEAARLIERGETDVRRLYLGRVVALAFVDRDPARGLALLGDLGLAGDVACTGMGALFLAARSRLRCAGGRPADGLVDARAAYDATRSHGFASPAIDAVAERYAEASLAIGAHEEAVELAAVAAREAHAFGAVAPIARARRLTALAGARGDRVDALRAAVDELAAADQPVEHARGLLDLGAALRREGHRADARIPLAAARELAHGHGATFLAERTLVELRAAGARPRRIMRRGVDALTPSELRVARMAADGHTNRSIAQQLFVTQKTVEAQLRATYRKLAIASRAELAPALDVDARTAAA